MAAKDNDRLAGILAELDRGRADAWTPRERDVVDERRWWRRPAAPEPGADLEAALDDEPTDSEEDVDEEPRSRADRRRRGLPGRDVRPRTPLVRAPVPKDTEVHPARAAVIGGAAIALLVALVLALKVWNAQQDATPRPVVATPTAAVTSAADRSTAQAAAMPGAPTTAAARVTVHVVGQVRRPGVVQLAGGARVDAALRAAGGALPGADLTQVNLARPVSDGEQIQVPKPGETPTPAPGGAPTSAGGPAPDGPTAPGGAGNGTKVNVNTADQTTLETLPGVGPVLAGRIIEWRTTNGSFTSVDDLGEVSGIGDKMLAQLRPHVEV